MSVPSTNDRILDAAFAAFARDPGSSLAEVAAAAGVGRSTVHRAFPTREALLDVLARTAAARIEAAFERAELQQGPAPEAFGRLLGELLPLADEFGLLASSEVWRKPELQAAWEALDGRLTALVDRGKAEGSLRPELPSMLVVDAFAGLVRSIGCGIADGRIAARTAAPDLLTLLLHGVSR
jgi:AcrR family transcriptional regulator